MKMCNVLLSHLLYIIYSLDNIYIYVGAKIVCKYIHCSKLNYIKLLGGTQLKSLSWDDAKISKHD